ncbi:ADYC domain-containing protein [Myxococcus sp. Y35]|uniref:ADYC domain-containing protein n=1 Tax=Pseudomyxococcus flavus TaxID=3115648 RepID=UPI003CFA1AA1
MGANKRTWAAVVVALGMVGCAGDVTEATPALRVSVAELAAPNGRNLNGRNLNGRNLNTTELGQMLVSVDLAGARLADAALGDVRLEGSVFHGVAAGAPVSGEGFLGARFTGNLGSGGTVELRVDDIQPGTGADADVWVYRVSYFDAGEGLWKPACPAEDGTALGAIPVMGRWDYRQGVQGGGAKVADAERFTFACEGAAIAKCVRFGYRPWASTASGASLADHHQACTRMVRADFCGDGTSHTDDGNWVNLYDSVGVQADSETWLHEAEWDTDGARCFTQTTRAAQAVSCPRTQLPGCGKQAHFQAGTLLMSEVPPAQ